MRLLFQIHFTWSQTTVACRQQNKRFSTGLIGQSKQTQIVHTKKGANLHNYPVDVRYVRYLQVAKELLLYGNSKNKKQKQQQKYEQQTVKKKQEQYVNILHTV